MLLQCSRDRIDIRPGIGNLSGCFQHIRDNFKDIHGSPEEFIIRQIAFSEIHLCGETRINAAQNSVTVTGNDSAFI